MKATIVSHAPVPDAESEQLYRFKFALEEESGAPPYAESVTLRTACVLVANLENDNAFVAMLRTILATDAAAYDSLIGRTFDDQREW
ncbi:hypothetical protein [Caballeronia sp. KNU42]